MISESEILPWRDYAKVRSQKYKEMADYKAKRRVELGERLSLIFENRETVLFQIQEMVYLDKLEDQASIRKEIAIYSTMIPCDGKLKATLFIHAWNENDLREVFRKLKGIYNSVFLKVGGKLIQGDPEAGREQGDEFSTVQYLTFDLEGSRSEDIEVLILHENYRVSTKLPKELAREVISEAYSSTC